MLRIPADIHDAMIEHCRAVAPIEACGLLGGKGGRVDSFHPLRNAAASETRYEADPRDVIEAVRGLRGRQAEILAIYHSHPRWPAIPSRTDLAANHYGDVPRIIVSLLDDLPDVKIYRLYPNAYQALPWTIAPPVGISTARTAE